MSRERGIEGSHGTCNTIVAGLCYRASTCSSSEGQLAYELRGEAGPTRLERREHVGCRRDAELGLSGCATACAGSAPPASAQPEVPGRRILMRGGGRERRRGRTEPNASRRFWWGDESNQGK
ncbi:unnamed protein product [Urochloa humidicola]